MTKIFRYTLLPVLLIICGTFQGMVSQAGAEDVRQLIARSYGIEEFDQVEKIQYTFNVKFGDKGVTRFWIWEPKIEKVTFKAGNSEEYITYNRREIDSGTSETLKKIDAWFINDNYWLLFPYRIAWDGSVKVEDIGSRPLPMGTGTAKCVVVTFPPSGGYTPGDVYELFLDDQYRMTQWVYHRGGSAQPGRAATWEDYRPVGPLTLSLAHQGDDKNFRLWFTRVGVQLSGADGWMMAK
jgi:hypothetical protein